MAKSTDLIKLVAELLGRAEVNVASTYRALREAGLVSKSGKGRSGARMRPRDAAVLLIGALGSDEIKQAPQVVRTALKTLPHRGTSSGFDKTTIPAMVALPPKHSIIDALEALFTASADGSLIAALKEEIEGAEGADDPGIRPMLVPAYLDIEVRTPAMIADIRIRGTGMSGHNRYSIPNPWDQHNTRHPPADDVAAWEADVARRHVTHDLEQYRKVGRKTVLRIGKLLSE